MTPKTKLLGSDTRRPNLCPTNNANSTTNRLSKGYKQLDIDEINQFKSPKAKYTAIRFDSTCRMSVSAERKIVCKCQCGNYFTTIQKSILTGARTSCDCLKHINKLKGGRSIEEINGVIPKESRLTAIDFVGYYKNTKHKTANFICSCGVKKELAVYLVTSGNTKSCGCYGIEKMNSPHKYSITIKKLRNCYTDMIQRCYNPQCPNYKIYGGRGVIVCDEWRNSYQSFLDWALQNGWKPGLQLDKDIIPINLGIPNKLYSPDMCQFVTRQENTRYAKMGEFHVIDGCELNLNQICLKYKIPHSTFYKAKRKKLTLNQIIEKYGKK